MQIVLKFSCNQKLSNIILDQAITKTKNSWKQSLTQKTATGKIFLKMQEM